MASCRFRFFEHAQSICFVLSANQICQTWLRACSEKREVRVTGLQITIIACLRRNYCASSVILKRRPCRLCRPSRLSTFFSYSCFWLLNTRTYWTLFCTTEKSKSSFGKEFSVCTVCTVCTVCSLYGLRFGVTSVSSFMSRATWWLDEAPLAMLACIRLLSCASSFLLLAMCWLGKALSTRIN